MIFLDISEEELAKIDEESESEESESEESESEERKCEIEEESEVELN